MCPRDIGRGIRDAIFVKPPTPPPPQKPVAPPSTQAPQTTPITGPGTPTPSPYSEDETKKKAKITGKKVLKKKRSAGTSQLQTRRDKPATGGLQGINTPQGVNTGGQQAAPAQQQRQQP